MGIVIKCSGVRASQSWFPSPSLASVPSVIIRSRVVSSTSIPCQESLPGFNHKTGRTNRRPRQVAKNACNKNAKTITSKIAHSPDTQRMSIGEHNGIPCDTLSRDNIESGNESQCGLLGNHIAEPTEPAPPLVWAHPPAHIHSLGSVQNIMKALSRGQPPPLRKPSWHAIAVNTVANT
jgi:hypothetical protein